MVARGERLGERSEAIYKYRLVLQNSHRDVKYSIGDMVYNIALCIVAVGYWKY